MNDIKYRKATKEEYDYILKICENHYKEELKNSIPDAIEEGILTTSVISVMISVFALIVKYMFVLIGGITYAILVGAIVAYSELGKLGNDGKLIHLLKKNNYQIADCVYIGNETDNTVRVKFNNGEEKVVARFPGDTKELSQNKLIRYVEFGFKYREHVFDTN